MMYYAMMMMSFQMISPDKGSIALSKKMLSDFLNKHFNKV